jgi:hypothetical protein
MPLWLFRQALLLATKLCRKQFTDLKQCFDFSRKGHNNFYIDELIFLFILNESRLLPNIRFNFQSVPSEKAINNKPQRPQRPRLGPNGFG